MAIASLRETLASMAMRDEQKEAKEPKPSRLEDARRVIEEYAKELREVIWELRRKMN
jgi:signal transduction histidine kinase